jgi:hypothetical protein
MGRSERDYRILEPVSRLNICNSKYKVEDTICEIWYKSRNPDLKAGKE